MIASVSKLIQKYEYGFGYLRC